MSDLAFPGAADPIVSEDDLLAPFRDACKAKDAFRVGPEMEKCGVFFPGGEALHYQGDRGIERILREFAKSYGWAADAEYPGGPTIALTRNGASITLEPGSQFELSGAAVPTIHEVCAEFRGHLAELRPISQQLGLRWLGLGFHPFARREDLTWVPKLRYGIMREYLPTRGTMALDMMLRTCTVQANYDYESEEDAMRKLRVALRLAPVTTAIFANSPFYEGGPFGGVSFRAKVWLDVDNDRSGLVPGVWKERSTFRDYVAWALDVPMFLIKRDGRKVENTGQTFRSFWKDGFQGHRATKEDWQTHLNTLFPEVRLKKTLEIRGADTQGAATACALPALWAGLFYDAKALDAAEELTRDFTLTEVEATRAQVWRHGLRAPFRGGNLVPVAQKLLALAEEGLARRGHKNASGKDERVHLTRISALVAEGRSPADELLDALGATPPADFRRAVMERTDLMAGA